MPSANSQPSLKEEYKTAKHDRYVTTEIIDELYYDFSRNRRKVYWINFVRGIFFGLGVFIGGTVVVAALIAIMAWLANFFPTFADFFNWLIDIMSRKV